MAAESEVKVEGEVKPVVPQVPAAEAKPKVEAEAKSEGEAKPAASAAEPKPEPKAEPQEDWRDKRIGQVTAQKRELEAKLAELQLQLKQGQQEPDAQFEARVAEAAKLQAAELAGMQKFADDCKSASEAGKKQFPDFERKITSLAKLVDRTDPTSLATYQRFVAAALETGEAPKLLHALGGDLNEAERLMGLPATKLAIELTKLALKPSAEPVSQLEKPITPVGNRGAAHTDIDPKDPERGMKLPIADWMERRNAQAAEENKRARGY